VIGKNDPANASKVVDENEEPLVVYHGTNKKFTKFKDKEYDNYLFTNDKSHSEIYGDKVLEVFMNVKKPSDRLYPKHTLMENKNDGYIQSFKSPKFFKEKTRVYVAINPIKSNLRMVRTPLPFRKPRYKV